MSDIVKKPDPPPTGGLMLNKGKLRSSASPFQQRVAQAKGNVEDATTMPNRLCLMLDKSSSMSEIEQTPFKQRIDLLKDAVENFARRCDFSNTAVAIETFPPNVELQLTTMQSAITTAMFGVQASGNTPMHSCVVAALEKIPMTRGIIVSDGEATDWHESQLDDEAAFIGEALDEEPIALSGVPVGILSKYKMMGIPIDCVHIGDSTSGEELLRRIAKETGGIYLKFTDVGAFATAFAYLTPGYRAMLTDGRVSAAKLGAKELKR